MLGWRSGVVGAASIRLWMALAATGSMSAVLVLFLIARLRASRRREVERQL